MMEFARNTDRYEKRFGVTAVEMGFISAQDLVSALRLQVDEDLSHGKHRLLGQILRDMGAMTPDQVEQVLTRCLKMRAAS